MTKKKSLNDYKNLLSSVGEIVIYDLETSGFKRNVDRILQFSAARYKLPSLELIEEENFYIKSPFSVDGLEATEINGITDVILNEKGISEEEAFERMKYFIKDDDLLGGYNIEHFDNAFMSAFYSDFCESFRVHDIIDIFSLAKLLIPKEKVWIDGKASYKLANVAKLFYTSDTQFQFHSSDDDVRATAFVLKNLIDKVMTVKGTPKSKEKSSDFNITSVRYFAPTKSIQRLYFNTNKHSFYYDIIKDKWIRNGHSLASETEERQLVNKYLKNNGFADINGLVKSIR